MLSFITGLLPNDALDTDARLRRNQLPETWSMAFASWLGDRKNRVKSNGNTPLLGPESLYFWSTILVP